MWWFLLFAVASANTCACNENLIDGVCVDAGCNCDAISWGAAPPSACRCSYPNATNTDYRNYVTPDGYTWSLDMGAYQWALILNYWDTTISRFGANNGMFQCAPGWSGSVVTTKCAGPNEPVVLSGCSAPLCETVTTPMEILYPGSNAETQQPWTSDKMYCLHGDAAGMSGSCTCECDEGWSGTHCTVAQPCTLTTDPSDTTLATMYCVNGGTVSGTYTNCVCDQCNTGWGGPHCADAQPCVATANADDTGDDGRLYCPHGTAGGTTGECTCTCHAGWQGTACDTGYPCVSSDNATKDGSDGQYYCPHGTAGGTTGACTCTECDVGWTGDHCDACAAGYGGDACLALCTTADYACVGGSVLGTVGSCACLCLPGYEGNHCDTCAAGYAHSYGSNACDPVCPAITWEALCARGTLGGTVPPSGTPQCTCTDCDPGWGGKWCDTFPLCRASPVHNDTLVYEWTPATHANDLYRGGWNIPYKQRHCVNGTVPNDPSPFEANGVCACNCNAGFSGDACETNIDDCAGVSCGHGTCVDGVNAYTCACEVGWVGDHCQFVQQPNAAQLKTNVQTCVAPWGTSSGAGCAYDWDTSQVTSMAQLFEDAVQFNQGIGHWDTSRVTDMSSMFKGTRQFDQDIGDWNTSSVTDMSNMFEGTVFNQDVSRWDTSRVTLMVRMFKNSYFNRDLVGWNLQRLNDADRIFEGSDYNPQPVCGGLAPYTNAVTRLGNVRSFEPCCACAHGVPDAVCATDTVSCASCYDGYGGPTCQPPCTDFACAHGTLSGYEGACVCTCATGYTGVHCNTCATGYVPPGVGSGCVEACTSSTDPGAVAPAFYCVNGGTVVGGIGECACHGCDAGWAGDHCHVNIDDCVGVSCGHGTCVDGLNSYTCTCETGWEGVACDTNVNDCLPHPCNSGTCVDGLNAYTCTCPPGVMGTHCELNDACVPPPCHNGTCTRVADAYTCTCDPGYAGTTCTTNIDDCVGVSCGHGTCVDGVNSYTCDCEVGYGGTTCGTNIDDCVGVSCGHGACVDGVNSYTCDCEAGWSGAACDVNVDDCAPCKHGVCTDLVNNYTCACETGWEGRNCDTPKVCVSTVDPTSADADKMYCEYGTVSGTAGACVCGDCERGFSGRYCHECAETRDLCVDRCVPKDECVSVTLSAGSRAGVGWLAWIVVCFLWW